MRGRPRDPQVEAEASAAALAGFVPGVASVGTGEVADDPQAESGSLRFSSHTRFPGEALEQLGNELLGHARAAVAHTHLDPADPLRRSHLDRWPTVREGVLQVVLEHCGEVTPVREHDQVRAARHAHLAGSLVEVGQAFQDELQYGDAIGGAVHRLRVDLRDGQELADERLQVRGAFCDAVQHGGPLVLAEPSLRVTQGVRQHADRRQRVAELVGHHCDHDVLLLQGGTHLLFGTPPASDVAECGDREALALHRRGGDTHLHQPDASARQYQLDLGCGARGDRVTERGADELPGRPREELLGGRVADANDPLVVDGDDPVGRRGQDRAAGSRELGPGRSGRVATRLARGVWERVPHWSHPYESSSSSSVPLCASGHACTGG